MREDQRLASRAVVCWITRTQTRVYSRAEATEFIDNVLKVFGTLHTVNDQ